MLFVICFNILLKFLYNRHTGLITRLTLYSGVVSPSYLDLFKYYFIIIIISIIIANLCLQNVNLF